MPRRRGANDAVIARQSAHGLGGGLALHRRSVGPHGHLHAKIYVFSHSGTAWVGSFNPSGNEPENAAVIAEIGDQDRGHNLLVGLDEPALVAALAAHVERLCAATSTLRDRFRSDHNRPVAGHESRLFFYPRLAARIVEPAVEALQPGDRIDGAVSHLKPGALGDALVAAARRGVAIRLVVHDTERRVPQALVDALAGAGVDVIRYRHPDELPMHAKFLLLTGDGGTECWFGSHNFNPRSRWLNHELLVATHDPAIVGPIASGFADVRTAALRSESG